MHLVFKILTVLIALEHLFFAWFEIFAWETVGPKVFKSFPDELFGQTLQLAANQGIYNSFLFAGLIWALVIKDKIWQANVATCFLLFVVVAGVFGAVTVSRTIFVVQALPAIIALILLYLCKNKNA